MRLFPCGAGAALALLLAVAGGVPLPARAADSGSVDVAARTFLLGCVAYSGDYAALRENLQPGRDLYLPQLSPAEARPFLRGRDGEAWARPDAGITLALLKAEQACVVFVRKTATEALFRRLQADLQASLGRSFAVRPAGEETKGALRTRFIDLIPSGSYREDLIRRQGGDPPGLRVAYTASETANPDLQAIITLGARSP